MKVYIVTSGEYSDYHIDRVFSTKEKAQEYVDHIGSDWRDIEEYNLDEETPRGVFGYGVIFYKDRTQAELVDDLGDNIYTRKDTLRWSAGYEPNVTFIVEAKNAPHAVKIASERFMQVKAMQYLFPRLKEECVGNGRHGYVLKTTPVYDYNTKEIILGSGDFIIESTLP